MVEMRAETCVGLLVIIETLGRVDRSCVQSLQGNCNFSLRMAATNGQNMESQFLKTERMQSLCSSAGSFDASLEPTQRTGPLQRVAPIHFTDIHEHDRT
jgi:hypothetical protein